MVNLELSYAHYSEMVTILKGDFSDVYELHIKLKST